MIESKSYGGTGVVEYVLLTVLIGAVLIGAFITLASAVQIAFAPASPDLFADILRRIDRLRPKSMPT